MWNNIPVEIQLLLMVKAQATAPSMPSEVSEYLSDGPGRMPFPRARFQHRSLFCKISNAFCRTHKTPMLGLIIHPSQSSEDVLVLARCFRPLQNLIV